VLVAFEPAVVSYAGLLKVFFEEHDPTQGMRHDEEVGTHARTATR
jgi:peptide-methionine (S)-S-oxide reductase